MRVTGRWWRRTIPAVTIAVLSLGCGPEVYRPPGTLEYEHPASAFYRLDRRVEIIPLDPVVSHHHCGFMTDRAYDDLMVTLDALDPTKDYDYGADDCSQGIEPRGLVHLYDFDHSPFACDYHCCHPDLLGVAFVYFLVENNFYYPEVNVEGEPYVAIEPDRPCS